MNALLYCNGQRLSKKIFAKFAQKADVFIGADGGGIHLMYHGVIPNVVIGDLDSFVLDVPEETQLIKDSDQETNDLEKALTYLLKHNYTTVYIAGATGKRLDHTLKNLSVLLQFYKKFNEICLIDNFGKHFIAQNAHHLKTRPGQVISLFPLSGNVAGITTQGVKYPLQNESLVNGKRDGSSNEATGSSVVIEYTSGNLLVSLGW